MLFLDLQWKLKTLFLCFDTLGMILKWQSLQTPEKNLWLEYSAIRTVKVKQICGLREQNELNLITSNLYSIKHKYLQRPKTTVYKGQKCLDKVTPSYF